MAKAKSTVAFGVTYPSLTALCEAHGHSRPKINHRLQRGLTIEQALVEADRFDGRKSHTAYGPWHAMLGRCHSPRNSSYKWYGALGIEVCKRWRADFWNFLDDMGPRPSLEHSIDRRNNALGYFKENCRWATAKEQSQNQRQRGDGHDEQTRG